MARPPRTNNNRNKPSSRAKKPTTIDLDAKDVKETSTSTTAGNNDEGGSKENMKKTASSKTPPIKATQSATAKTAPKKNPSVFSKKPVETVKVSESGKSDDTPPKPVGDTKSVKTSTGFLKLATAGIIGGLITLIGAGAMQYGGLLPLPVKTSQPQPAPPAPAVDLTPLQTKIAELQSKIQNIEANVVPIVDLTPIETRIAALEEAGNEIWPAANADPKIATELSGLKTRLETLSQTSRELEKQVTGLASAATGQAAPGELIDTTVSALTDLSRKNSDELGSLQKKIEALTSKIDEDVDARIASFDEKISKVSTGKKLANSVAINALKSALQNGNPYLATLTSLETLNGSSAPLEMLKQSATTGIASTKTLLLEFHRMQGDLLRAASNDPQAGLTERMMASIRSLVTISSDTPISGDTPQAIISRIDASLKTGNLDQVLVEWNSLPQQARQVAQSWMDKLDLRMKADDQFSQLVKIIQTPAPKAAD